MILYGFPANGSLAYSPDNKIVAASAGNIFRYWSTSSGRELKFKPGSSRRENLCYAIYRQDGQFLFASSALGVVFSDQNLQHFCQVQQNKQALSEYILPDGSIIAQSLPNQSMEVWDADHMDREHPTPVQAPGDVLDVTISTDGTLLATASDSGTIEIYELDTMTRLKTLDLKTGSIRAILFSSDGRYLIAGCADGTLRFFGLYP
jgi:WD40 repeat protein